MLIRKTFLAGRQQAIRKYAATTEEPKEFELEDLRPVLQGGAGFLGHRIGLKGLGAGAMALDKRMPQINVIETLPEIARNMDIPTPYLEAGLSDPSYQHLDYSGKTPTVRPKIEMPSNQGSEAILAHEMGHAKNWHGASAKAHGRIFATRIGRGAGPYATAYAMGAETPSYIPAAIHAAIQSNELLDEGLASGRALKYMIGKHGLGKGLLHSAPLLPAFGTYAANALAPLAITKIRRWNEGDKEPKVASASSKKPAATALTEQPEESETEILRPALRGLGGYLGHSFGMSGLGRGIDAIDKRTPQIDASQHLPGIARYMGIPVPQLDTAEGADPSYSHIDLKDIEGDLAKGKLNVTPTIHLPSNLTEEATLAHELGHAKNWQGRGAGTFLGAGGLRMLGDAAPFASAYAMGAEKPSYTPAIINAALQTGTLLDEGLASARAIKYMVDKHGLSKGLLHSSSLLPAFGTYAATALAPLAITKIRRWNESNEEPKVAGAMGESL